MPLLGSVLIFSLLVIYPIGFVAWGQAAMAIAAMRRGLTVGHAFSGWGHSWRMGWLAMVKMTYLSLWSLLFFVPGVVKSLSYAMADFVAVDHPDWGANRCIAESCRLMKGNRWRYFVLNLSLLGWILLMMVVSWVPCAATSCRCSSYLTLTPQGLHSTRICWIATTGTPVARPPPER